MDSVEVKPIAKSSYSLHHESIRIRLHGKTIFHSIHFIFEAYLNHIRGGLALRAHTKNQFQTNNNII
jgi:hypothetical protein